MSLPTMSWRRESGAERDLLRLRPARMPIEFRCFADLGREVSQVGDVEELVDVGED
ncbi:hypothetical protein ABZV58_23525 [Nocardia sp. NPDC004654]|uniref:hypothetical protein n=1 Tax=Nocardia sp. NPDC004654 TaxID=3154776 RepID=UPI00339E7304